MTYDEFLRSLDSEMPPIDGNHALLAMWYDAKGDWDSAHRAAQAQEDADGSWVHAYLHRVEGDPANAAYWYRRARRPVCEGDLKQEWEAIVRDLLAR